MSLSALKKNRANTLDKLKKAAEDQSKSGSSKTVDERMWRPIFDKERGVGSAVIRFMPAVEGEDLPWAKVIKHALKVQPANGTSKIPFAPLANLTQSLY